MVENKSTRQEYKKRAYETISLMVFMIVTVVIALSVAIGVDTIDKAVRGARGQTLDERISVLTTSLQKASSSIDDIEAEVAKRASLAKKLQQDADEAKRLSTLNAAQVAAVSQALRGELRTETPSWWWTALNNLVFALIGTLFCEGFRVFRKWRLGDEAE